MRVARLLTAAAVLAGVLVSAQQQAHAVGPHVVINELHYHTSDDDPAKEFIELLNAGDAAQDLTGWCIDGVGFCFASSTSIGPGALLVIGATQYTGGLSNGGEHIRLLDGTSAVVDEVEYEDGGEWPARADGEGPSLERRDPLEPGDDPGNWMSGTVPTRGTTNSSAAAGLLPVFSDVEHTVLPAPGASIDVVADLAHASSATLYYRLGFGGEIAIPMAVGGGQAGASIPGQAAGALVRYRLEAIESGRTGTWPRQGDGANYTGTTVAKPGASPLPRFDWYIPDATYTKAFKDLKRLGDDGYPSVIAYNGEIFDNTLVRVKGQVSRYFPKKKWKFSLPAGHELSAPGLLPLPVDEFALHASYSDKSLIRETLSSEWMTEAGVTGTQGIFPVRLEKNNAFYGLYSYVEAPDGSWRDRNGYDEDNALVYAAGDNTANVTLAPKDATISQRGLRFRYDRETREWESDDNALRALIRGVNTGSISTRRAWILDHVDVPQVVNALAADSVIQHDDMGHKNYRLILGSSGRWQVVPNDYDLSWGRSETIHGQLREEVGTRRFARFFGNRLMEFIAGDLVLRQLLVRRTRSLTDQLLRPDPIETRVNELIAATATDAVLDRQLWPTYGEQQPPVAAQNEILTGFVPFKRKQFTDGTVLPLAQIALPPVVLTGVQPAPAPGAPEWVELRNLSTVSVDISGWTISGMGLTVAPGVVILPGQRVRFVDDITKDTHPSLGGVYVAGEFATPLDDGYGAFRLMTANGDIVSELTYGTPPPNVPFVVVNEINGVSDANLPGNGADPFWGATPTGNGKDWVELAVVSDHTDLRGWHVRVADNGNAAVDLVLPNDAGLADVRAGTILTISEELATDLTVDPNGGDWWMNLQMTGFNTSNSNTQVELRDAANQPVFGPVGEGVNPASGVGSDEVAALNASPSAAVTASSPYADSKTSSFGQPNPVTGGSQDFSALRDPVVLGADTIAPGNVSGLGLSNVAARTLDASWSSASDNTGVVGYRVYLNGRLAAEPAGTSVGLSGLPDSTTVAIEVIAVDASGNHSAIPARVTVTLGDGTPPGPVRGVSFSRTKSSIRVFWTKAQDLSGIANYRVELVGRPPVLTKNQALRFSGLASGTTYEVRIQAVDKVGLVGIPVVLTITTR